MNRATDGSSSNQSTNKTYPSNEEEEEDEDPAQIADRLRLLNHMISLIDGLAAGGLQEDSRKSSERRANHNNNIKDGRKSQSSASENMNTSKLTDPLPSLIKVHVGGATVGYAVGLLPSDTIHDSDSRTEHLTHLLTFIERILEACEEVNSKAKSTHSFIHLRVALHAGPALAGLISKHRPVFNLWGDPVNVCLHLIQESHVPALNRQHLLLATDDVINAIPAARLNTTLKSGQPIVWRCVDTQTGRILLSSQVPASAAPGGPNRSRPCLPLHFCSILATVPEPDVDYANRAAFAMLNLAKRTSFKTPEFQLGNGTPRNLRALPPASSEHLVGGHSGLRQSVAVSQPLRPVISNASPRPASLVHGNNPSTPPNNVGVSTDIHRYSRSHPLQPVSMSQTQMLIPPPPPPHKRSYAPKTGQIFVAKQTTSPGGPVELLPAITSVQSNHGISVGPQASHSITEGLCDSVTNHAYVRASPERKYSEPPSSITRQAVRRGVVSQCASHPHDYSIVNFEPPELVPRFQDSKASVRASLQPPPPPHPKDRRGEYWPNLPNKSSANGVPLDMQVKQCCLNRDRSEERRQTQVKVPEPQSNLHPPRPLLPRSPAARRPVSLSSTDSFLAAERACAVGCDEVANITYPPDLPQSHLISNEHSRDEENSGSGAELVSHHNPLYTDNEYDSMAESRGNLVDVGKRRRKKGALRPSRSNSAHSNKPQPTELQALVPHRNQSSQASSMEKKNGFVPIINAIKPSTPDSHLLGAKEALTTDYKLLDFPDIQRPPSPNEYLRRKMTPVQSNVPHNPLGYGSGNQFHPACPSSSSTSSAARNGAEERQKVSLDSGNSRLGVEESLKLFQDDCLQSDRVAMGKIVSALPNAPTAQGDQSSAERKHFPNDPASPVISDVDAIEGEYAGTYSLGPLSMAVQPSVAEDGITSCDGDFEDDAAASDDDEVDEQCGAASQSPSSSRGGRRAMQDANWSHQQPVNFDFPLSYLPVGAPPSCMTDSLVANPDLDAHGSEIAEDFELSRLNSPDEPIDPKHASSLLEAAFVPLSFQHDGAFESDGDEVFAYHNRPGVFHINPYSVQGHARLPLPQQHSANGRSVVSNGHFPSGQQFISEHSIQLQCSPKPNKPTLPEIAPVSLPNFAPLSRTGEVSQSEYDNLNHANAALLSDQPPSKFVGKAQSMSSENQVANGHWYCVSPERNIDAMSGYAADAPSSVYDTGDEDEDENNADKRKHGYVDTEPSRPKFGFDLNGIGPASQVVTHVLIRGGGYSTDNHPHSLDPNTTPDQYVSTVDHVNQSSHLNRAPSTAGSQASSVDQQRSEYDNVARSTTSGRINHAAKRSNSEASSPSMPKRAKSPRGGNSHRYVASVAKASAVHSVRTGIRAMFDAEIAAEAQRISRQFRAMGWIPASDYFPPAGDADVVEVGGSMINHSDLKLASPRIASPVRDPPRPHLFLLPMDPQLSTPCSRQASFHNRRRRLQTSAADSETVTTVTSQFDDDDEDYSDYAVHTDASDFEDVLDKTGQQAGGCGKSNPNAWVLDSYPGRELGCLMVRPRSLSATCLNEAAPGGDTLASILLSSGSSDVSSDEKTGGAVKVSDAHERPLGRVLEDARNIHVPPAPSARLCDRQRKAVRRAKSSRNSHRSDDNAENDAGFARLKRRAARVRSLLPPDLQPFILPGCMSSLSRSSSVASSLGLHHPKTGYVFLSLSRRQPRTKGTGARRRKRDYLLPRSSSDPQLHLHALERKG